MKKLWALSAVVLLSTACTQVIDSLSPLFGGVSGNGVIETETRENLGSFATIDVQNALEVDYTQDKSLTQAQVTVEADANLLPMIQTTVSNNRLLIKTLQSFNTATRTRVTVRSPELEALVLSGAARGKVSNWTAIPSGSVELSGASRLSLSGSSPALTVTAAGSSEVTLSVWQSDNLTATLSEGSWLAGEATLKSLIVNGSGASRLEGAALTADTAEVTLSGASRGRLRANTRLKANLSGASELIYTGSPQVERTLSGASTLRSES
jgi:hypothetical protein